MEREGEKEIRKEKLAGKGKKNKTTDNKKRNEIRVKREGTVE
jgi:hypothetical protein